jgi:hypothetical protein
LLWILITTNHRPHVAGYVTQTHFFRVMPGHNDPVQQVPFREDANQLPFLIKDAHSANFSGSHELGRFHHGRRSLHRVRLTITNNISDQHSRASCG